MTRSRLVQLRRYPHQQSVREALAVERAHGHVTRSRGRRDRHGQDVIAALNYARLRRELGDDPSWLGGGGAER